MGLQGQFSDVSSESIPILLVSLVANCVAHIRCLLLTLLHSVGFFPRLDRSPIDESLILGSAAGSGLAGLILLSEQLDLNRVSSAFYDGASADGRGGDRSECVVCLERLSSGNRVRELACSHVFHKECLDGWIDRLNFNCPLCRSPLVSGERVAVTHRHVARDILAWYSLR